MYRLDFIKMLCVAPFVGLLLKKQKQHKKTKTIHTIHYDLEGKLNSISNTLSPDLSTFDDIYNHFSQFKHNVVTKKDNCVIVKFNMYSLSSWICIYTDDKSLIMEHIT